MSKTSAKELFNIAEEDFRDGQKLYANNLVFCMTLSNIK
jgi:hypothetical protein